MLTTDILIALWAISLAISMPIAYFKGAKRQLKTCVEHRYDDLWKTASEWGDAVDISTNRQY